MLFHVIGVKEEIEKKNLTTEENVEEKYDLEILLETKDITTARKILGQLGIITVSIKEELSNKDNFGDTYIHSELDGEKFIIISPIEDIAKATTFFLTIGIPIRYINSKSKPRPNEEIKKILEESLAYVKSQKQKKREISKKKEEQKESVFLNKEMLKMKEIIQEIIDRGDELIERAGAIANVEKIKKFKEIRSELGKLKMGTNQIKIVGAGEEYLTLMEEIESEFLLKKEQELGNLGFIEKESCISNMDIIKEYFKFFKTVKIKLIGGSIKKAYENYATFGLSWIYIRFLAKDLLNKFSDMKQTLYKTYDRLEFFIIAVILQIIIYIIFKNTGQNENLDIFILLSNIGIIGIVVFFIKFIRRNNIMYLIILFPIIVIISIVLIRNLKIMLAL